MQLLELMKQKVQGIAKGSLRRRVAVAMTAFLLLAAFLALKGSAGNTVRLVNMDPKGEVPTRTNFLFIFSSDVVPKSQVGKMTTTGLIRFRPAVPGKIRWETTSRVRYFPEVSLQPSTSYTVEFSADLAADLKKTLSGDRRAEFTTEQFRVKDASTTFVYNPQRKTGLMFQARLTFNYPVAAETLQREMGLMFADNRQPIRFTVQLSNGGRQALVVSELLQRGKNARSIEISLPAGFRCMGGSIGLKERFARTADFHERRALTLEDSSALSDNGRNEIALQCSEPPDPEAVSAFISVKPAVKFKVSVTGSIVALRSDSFKPGRSYQITALKGLPSLNGNPLGRDWGDAVTFPDLEPSVSFNSPGRYLSSKGRLNLGIETVNTAQVEVEVARIFANNIVTYLGRLNEDGRCYSADLERLGRVVDRRTIDIANSENEIITTPLNLGEYLSGAPRGIFQVSVCDPEDRWLESSKVVIVTDLGILAKMAGDELIVWVNSLDTLAPRAGVQVSLMSYNNQQLVSGETDENGVVRFGGLGTKLADFRSYVILADSGDDISFLCLDDSLIEKTDFAVEGRAHLVQGYEAFLYTDRGVFRPGDRANLTAVVRGPNASAPPEFPVRLAITGPDGMVFREFADSTKENGLCQFSVEIPDYARTGKYVAQLYVARQPIGTTAFSVEEFMPDRIKVETSSDKPRYSAGDVATVHVTGTNLYGPPAAGRRVDLSVRLEAVPFAPAAYRSYSFGDPSRKFSAVDETIGWDELDGKGEATFTYGFPDNVAPPGMVRAVFQATVTEEGGRSVSGYRVAEYHPYRTYIGVRNTGDYYAKVGEAYPIKLVQVDPTGNPIANAAIDVEVYSVTWNSIYRRDRDGHYTYHSEREEERIGRETVRLGANGEGQYAYKPGSWGCYKIVFSDPRTGSRSAVEFYATGWGYAPWAMDHPDRIELDLDKATYKPGETATVQIRAPFAGKALVTIEREKVLDVRVIDLKENTGVITVPVDESFKPNVYVTVQVIRTVKKLDKRAPTRAYGTVPLMVDCSAERLDVSLTVPEEWRPDQEVEIPVSVGGLAGEAYLTLAAVDEGICQLTDFQTPDPMAFFYGKRALNIDTYDLYGMLLPEVDPVSSPDQPGGDEDAEGVRRRNLNPVAVRRVKPVSLWSGTIKLDSSGKGRIKLRLPQFNGTLRLMAVAMSGPRFGSATRKVLVRDPIVLTSTFPRFAAPGDRFVVPVTVFNGTGKDGVFTLKLAAGGPVNVDGYDWKELTLAPGQERTARFAVVARDAAGPCKFTLVATGNGARTDETTELPVRPARPVTSQVRSGSFNAGKPLDLDLKGSWMPGTSEAVLIVAPMPSMKFAGSLRYLLGYPYGCVEQTTSKLFPLLYFEDLARAAEPGLFPDGKASHFLIQGIEKLQAMQLRDGSFSYWPGGDDSSHWGSTYAAHFLVEARKAGYAVPDGMYDRMLGYLTKAAREQANSPGDLQERVYALYVLSLAGRPQRSIMAFIRGQRLDSLYPDSRAMLSAAYYVAGDKKTARDLMPATFAGATLGRQKGGTFNSSIRTDAIILSVLADTDPAHPAAGKLVEKLAGSATAARWGTTQENAFAFLALGKVFKNRGASNYTGEVLAGGQRIASFDSKTAKRISDPRLTQGKVSVRINGSGECYYYAESSGVPTAPPEPVDNGITVRRDYFDRTGNRLDPRSVKQGTLVVVRLTIRTVESDVDNVAIVDMLPTGLEIENPRLATSARLTWLSGDLMQPSYMDIRDDRLILFASFAEPGYRYFYYAARAVSCGTFVAPAVKAECMYAPEVVSISPMGSMQIDN